MTFNVIQGHLHWWTLKMWDMTIHYRIMRHNLADVENAGRESAGPRRKGG